MICRVCNKVGFVLMINKRIPSMYVSKQSYIPGASLLLYSKVCALMCDDIDRQACQLIFNKKSDMCNDTHMASVTCPRFCNECGKCKTI